VTLLSEQQQNCKQREIELMSIGGDDVLQTISNKLFIL
jgi:hypothetical protein